MQLYTPPNLSYPPSHKWFILDNEADHFFRFGWAIPKIAHLFLYYKGKTILINMSNKKETKKTNSKKRADQYDPKVKFDGSFKDLVSISIKDASKKKASPKKQD